ncbi:MAG: hypothetical protein R3E18_05455 [Sphingomonadaceae bacterium]|nr:hypothetical protein [Sphingomonadaceae bacterium]
MSMHTVSDIEAWLDSGDRAANPADHARELLQAGEEVLTNWIIANGGEPENTTREGFRLLALHRQGAKGDPSFNACRETCRELAYHFNLLHAQGFEQNAEANLAMMRLVTKHLVLFIGGKLQEAGIGEFCCSSKSVRISGAQLRDHMGV